MEKTAVACTSETESIVGRAKGLTMLSLVLMLSVTSFGKEHSIHPGEVPQDVIDRAAPGDRIVFLPGLHQHKLGKHQSILYVDKSVEIELQANATLKLADGETILEPTAEITTDHGAPRSSTTYPSAANMIWGSKTPFTPSRSTVKVWMANQTHSLGVLGRSLRHIRKRFPLRETGKS